MPETQAKSGGPGSSATPVDGEPKKDGAAPAGREAAGRAAVPGDAPSAPKYTRAPGMAPPPGDPGTDGDASSSSARPAPATSRLPRAHCPLRCAGEHLAPFPSRSVPRVP